MPHDLVVFRRWEDTGDIIALFPEIPADIDGRYCMSYEHVGQHGAADFQGVIQNSVPVTPREYARLARELTLIGYDLKPIRRASFKNPERRRREAKRLREDTRTTGVLKSHE